MKLLFLLALLLTLDACQSPSRFQAAQSRCSGHITAGTADLPVQAPIRYEQVINLKTAGSMYGTGKPLPAGDNRSHICSRDWRFLSAKSQGYGASLEG
jgi:hypothetical protein